MRIVMVRLAVLVLLLTGLAVPSTAQVFTGRIEFSAVDTTGAVLPGVTVEVTGPRTATQMTDDRGEARFLALPPGTYTVTATLQGFTEYRNENVVVVTGAGAPLRATLTVAGLAQQVEVTAEGSPIIDPKALTTSTNVTYDELQKVPSSRDPWVVLQTVPGVIVAESRFSKSRTAVRWASTLALSLGPSRPCNKVRSVATASSMPARCAQGPCV